MEDIDLDSPEVDKLATLVEEATRANTQAPKRFIQPARGTLDRGKSRRHHLVFGRRGSGKTSLLRKASADLSLDRIPTAFVDLEAFKGHAYPDVLLSILIETFSAFDQWLKTAAVNSAAQRGWWLKLFGGKPRRPPLDKTQVEALRHHLSTQITELKKLLYSEDEATVTRKETASSEASSEDGFNLALGEKTSGIAVGVHAKDAEKSTAGSEVVESNRRDKVQFLHRHIIEYQKMIDDLVTLSGSDTFLFLDDLYHIRRIDQSNVLDYFHRILKGRCGWLKVGTIKHRTEWYHHGDPPIGIKLGDDCDDIDLDITLEKYQLAREFLLKILDQLVAEAGLDSHRQILSEGAMERLVLASGGVARDFLTIFRRTIDVARERGENYRGPKINAEDVNLAAGEHDTSKRDELKRDTLEERRHLEATLAKIQDFCIKRKLNCFLVERDMQTAGAKAIGELVDLRFLHVVESRTTVRDRPGQLYTAYMLDISQYTGARRRRDLEMIRFWDREQLSKIRRSSHVFDPDKMETPEIEQG